MRISDSGSGEMDSVPELSRLYGTLSTADC